MVLPLLLITSRAFALEIHEIRWSFQDRPVAYHFNPVTFLIENNQESPFEGELRFQPESFRGQPIGLAISTSVYIAPHDTKWVQLYPYFSESNANWTATWQEGEKQNSKSFLAPVPVKTKAIVQLVSAGSLERGLPGIKQYPEEIFPPLTDAVGSLETVVLDHVPRWDKARRTAFIQWLYLGGTLHLFQNTQGEDQVFPETFSPLNQSSSLIRYGQGKIIRHPQKINQISSNDINTLVQSTQKKSEKLSDRTDKLTEAYYFDSDSGFYPHADIFYYQMSDEEILTTLTEMSKPHRIWYLNFFLAFLYLLVVGPGYYFATRLSRRNHQFYLWYFLGIVVFSLIFYVSGKYSSNQNSQVHSLMLASVMPDQDMILSEWSSLGMVTGGTYEITHEGEEHLYAACNEFSRVNGVCKSGSQGMLYLEIPPNSSQSYLHKSRTSKTGFAVSVESVLKNESGLEALALRIDDKFPTRIIQIYFLAGSKLYELKQEQDRLVFRGRSLDVASVLYSSPQYQSGAWATFSLTGTFKLKEREVDDSLDQLFPVLLSRVTGFSGDQYLNVQRAVESTGKLLVLGETPETLFLKSPQVMEKKGHVLYSLDVPLNEQFD